jgi:hypothetical protein
MEQERLLKWIWDIEEGARLKAQGSRKKVDTGSFLGLRS